MPNLNQEQLKAYLEQVLQQQVSITRVTPLGELQQPGEVKGFGYGVPLRIDYQAADQTPRSAVLHTLTPNPFGHEHMADRARDLLWAHQAFNQLPLHVRSIDIGAFQRNGSLIPLGEVEECCLLTEYADGMLYAGDLEHIRDANILTGQDQQRADALCDYLIRIHKKPGTDPGLYVRRIRELVGHSECIMGIADSYPAQSPISPKLLEDIEHRCIRWRWRLKPLSHRLRQIHGDFHPWNILFTNEDTFSLLDRSRGEFGDPADDVCSLTLNYLFFSLQRSGRLEGPFEHLFLNFWQRYLKGTGDAEMLKVAAPFFAFRGLVMASPVWYPSLQASVRQALLNFIVAVLDAPAFDPGKANEYCGN